MSSFGIVCPPVPGHLNPMIALGTELMRRGHRVAVINMVDVGERVRAAGLEFIAVGASDHPAGSLPRSLAQLGQLHGAAAIRFTVRAVRATTAMLLRDGPAAVRGAGLDALIIDQMEAAGVCVAEFLDLPWATVANALPIDREPGVPPFFVGWRPRAGVLGRLRDALGYAVSDHALAPVRRELDRWRRAHGLRAWTSPADSFSPLVQISQIPEAFDFPRRRLPAVRHGVGPLRSTSDAAPPFPFERLDGRPLVYASLGSMQGSKRSLFAAMAAACARLPVQLVITHGHGLNAEEERGFAGDPLVVAYAPQRALLARAALVLTHAGLNTMLDAMAAGVPAVAIPITFEQPAIAARLAWHGAGEVIPMSRATPDRIQAAVARVLADDRCSAVAARMRAACAAGGGAVRAAEIIERSLITRSRAAATA